MFGRFSARVCASSAALGLLLTLFPLLARAQASTFLSIHVTSDNAPVAGAGVELRGGNLDLHRVTDAHGDISFDALSVGTYRITVKKGDLSATRTVDLGATGVSLNIELQTLQKIGETVVSARPNPAQSSGTDVVMNADTLKKLPVGGSLPDILLQLPTAAHGSNGEIHINGDHNGLQYIVDGVVLPEGLNRIAGNEIDPSTIAFLNALQGAYPAQYGGPFATILDIGTKTFTGPTAAGFVGTIGSYNYYDGVLNFHTPVGAGGSLSLVGRLNQNGRALDPPVQGAPHNTGSLANQFLRLSLPVAKNDYLNFDFIHALQTFQIPPDIADGVPANTDDNEYQEDTFAAIQFRHQIGADGALSFGPAFKSSRLLDTNDLAADLAAGNLPSNACGPIGDFSDCPIFSVFADRRFTELSFNGDFVYRSARHEVRAGILTGWQSVPKNYVITMQAGNNLSPQNPDGTFTAVDRSTINGTSQAAYLQDGWQVASHWRVDYGLRFDAFSVASTTSIAPYSNQYNQWSPRAKLTYFFNPRTSLYLYYGRLFTPFSLETIDPAVAASLYVPGPTNPGPVFDLKPQRDSLYEAGFHVPIGVVDVGFRASHKVSTDYIDDTQVGATNLHQDINFPNAITNVFALDVQTPLAGRGSAYFSLANVNAVQSANCETQLLQNCGLSGPPGGPWVQADHDQKWTSSGGVILNDKRGGWFSLNGEYGSGLSQNPINCPPTFDTLNCKVPPHLVFNAAKAFGFPFGQLVLQVQNIFNDRYALTLNNSLQGTHWAQPRAFYFKFILGNTQ